MFVHFALCDIMVVNFLNYDTYACDDKCLDFLRKTTPAVCVWTFACGPSPVTVSLHISNWCQCVCIGGLIVKLSDAKRIR